MIDNYDALRYDLIKRGGLMKKKIAIGMCVVILCVAGVFVVNSLSSKAKEDQERAEQEKTLQEIISRFSYNVITNKETFLYTFENGAYQKCGTIQEGYPLELVNEPIDVDTQYFKVKNFDAYINIYDVDGVSKKFEKDQRYTRYVMFNENVKTPTPTQFYNEDDELVLTLDTSFDLPIIIKEDGKYGVAYDDTLFYVKEVESVYPSDNTTIETRKTIRTFTYHTVYDPETQTCASVEICHPIEQFESHLQYLKDEDFLTLTMEELELFLDSKIQIPRKTVALTLDDGIYLENSVPLVEKYGMNATFFIITSKVDVSEYMDSKYARFESHSDDMHNNYKCPKNTTYSQGGQMLCEPYDSMIADLKLSQEKLQGSNYYAYPFFDFNDRAKAALKDAGFHLAFIGQYTSNGYSDKNTDKMLIRRTTIFGNYPIEMFMDFCTDND